MEGYVFTSVWHSVHRGIGACVAGGHAWQGACMAGAMHGRGHAWQEGCVVGACMTGEMATAADGTHPTGMHSCCF